jgi:hypothetical protein
VTATPPGAITVRIQAANSVGMSPAFRTRCRISTELPFSGTRMIKMLMLPAISGQVDPASVPHRELYSGARMPAIGLGTFGSDHAEPDEVANAVQGAYEVGCPPLRLCRCLRQRASRQHGISGIVHVRGAAVSAYSVSLFSVSVFLLTRDGANSRIPLVNDTGTVV